MEGCGHAIVAGFWVCGLFLAAMTVGVLIGGPRNDAGSYLLGTIVCFLVYFLGRKAIERDTSSSSSNTRTRGRNQ